LADLGDYFVVEVGDDFFDFLFDAGKRFAGAAVDLAAYVFKHAFRSCAEVAERVGAFCLIVCHWVPPLFLSPVPCAGVAPVNIRLPIKYSAVRR